MFYIIFAINDLNHLTATSTTRFILPQKSPTFRGVDQLPLEVTPVTFEVTAVTLNPTRVTFEVTAVTF